MGIGRIEDEKIGGIDRYRYVPPMQEEEIAEVIPPPVVPPAKPWYKEPITWIVGGILALLTIKP